MANSGPDTNGSQFIMHADYPLPPQYVIFARVTSGLIVVDALANVPTTMGADGAQSQPVTPVKITKVTVRPTRAQSVATGPGGCGIGLVGGVPSGACGCGTGFGSGEGDGSG